MQLTLEIDYDPTINVTVIGLNICIIFILSARKEQENLVDNHRCHDGLRPLSMQQNTMRVFNGASHLIIKKVC